MQPWHSFDLGVFQIFQVMLSKHLNVTRIEGSMRTKLL